MEPLVRVDRLPGARTITVILWVILLGGVAAVIAVRCSTAPSTRIDEKATLSLLKSEALKFLVVRRTATQIVVEYEQEDWLGHWQGVLWASVSFLHGVDLDEVSPSDIRRDGDTFVVRLPEPKLLAFTVEPGSVRILTKSTAVAKIEDILHNGHRRLLERRLQTNAMEFAREHGLMPTKAQMLQQLNEAAAAFRDAGVRVRFE